MSEKVVVCRTCEKSFWFDTRSGKWSAFCSEECRKKARRKNERNRRLQTKSLMPASELNKLAVRSYKEIGEIMGIHPEVVRQIERRALTKLRKALKQKLDLVYCET